MPKKKHPYNDRKGFAYVYVNRKPVALKAPDGSRCKTGTPEALEAYHRFCLELQSSPTGHIGPTGEKNVTVKELAAAFLDHSQEAHKPINYGHYRIVLTDFLVPLYGEHVPVASFTPKSLKLVREAMIQSGRYCRKHINSYVGRIIGVFRLGEFYSVPAYRRAIKYAIVQGNKAGIEIPHWFPYMLRHAAATAIEEADGLDAAQAQLGHTTADMTKRYSKAALKTREKLARNRRNPFEKDGEDEAVA